MQQHLREAQIDYRRCESLQRINSLLSLQTRPAPVIYLRLFRCAASAGTSSPCPCNRCRFPFLPHIPYHLVLCPAALFCRPYTALAYDGSTH